jgi:hypothetical protein
MVLIGHKPLFIPDCDEVHVSVAFSWDVVEGSDIAMEYESAGYTVRIGGPYYRAQEKGFTPGMYLKPGYVITSRGCPNRCWFCSVWQNEGDIVEIPITEGWNVLDSNLLACSEKHIMAVLDMLKGQPHPAEFTGGLDPERMTVEIMREIRAINPKQIFTAYDSPNEWDVVKDAIDNCWKAGFTIESHAVRCFVLIGYPKDTFESAEYRLRQVLEAGAFPMAMLYRDYQGRRDPAWIHFQRRWARPAIIAAAPDTR